MQEPLQKPDNLNTNLSSMIFQYMDAVIVPILALLPNANSLQHLRISQ
jgi:hypothetical protein